MKKKDSLAFEIFISFKHRNILKKTQIFESTAHFKCQAKSLCVNVDVM